MIRTVIYRLLTSCGWGVSAPQRRTNARQVSYRYHQLTLPAAAVGAVNRGGIWSCTLVRRLCDNLDMRIRGVVTLLSVCLSGLVAQETRSTINGHVTDRMSAAIGGANVLVTHVETNTSVVLATDRSGYYEASLLLPGDYSVSAEALGFKTTMRRGIVLAVGARVAVDLQVEIGVVTETVHVTAEAPVLETGSIEGGSLIDNQALMDLPVMGNNPI